MVVAKKNVADNKKATLLSPEKEPKIRVLDIIGNIEKWGVQQKINIINAGVSKSELELFKKQTGLDYNTLARMLGVTKATFHNKKANEKFNPQISDRLMMVAEIFADGIEVFGEKERFDRWLVSNIRAIGGRRPIDYLNTLHGMTEIKHLIGRIAHGVYS